MAIAPALQVYVVGSDPQRPLLGGAHVNEDDLDTAELRQFVHVVCDGNNCGDSKKVAG